MIQISTGTSKRLACLLLAIVWPTIATSASAQSQALVDVTIHVDAERTLEHGTVVMRDGRIVAVGPSQDIDVPEDARVWSRDGLHVYAGFLESWWVQDDLALELPSGDGSPLDPGLAGPSSNFVKVHPERRVADGLALAESAREELRGAGFTMAQVAAPDGVLRGSAALVHLGDVRPSDSILRRASSSVVDLTPSRQGRSRYPNSVMGAIAVVRQMLTDARYYQEDRAHAARKAGQRPRSPFDPSLEALQPVVSGELPLLFDSDSMLLLSRAAQLCRQWQVRGVGVATGGEWRRMDLLPGEDFGLILPVDFPQTPKLPRDEDWIQVSLDELRHLDVAASMPAMLRDAGRPFAITTKGLKKSGMLYERLALARKRGLDKATALEALTSEPARLLGLDAVAGTVEEGKWAMLTVFGHGELLDEKARPMLLFIDGMPQALDGWFEEPKSETPDSTAHAEIAETKDIEESVETDPNEILARMPGEDRGVIRAPSTVLISNATIWTSAEQGVLENADLLVRDGRIRAIGSGLELPKGALHIDAQGKHVTAGLIDAHSHIAVLGGVNEGTHSCTSEVRIADVLNSEDRAIYEALAGGLTTAHIMHGSANAIGGQCQAIKLRWGSTPDGLVFEGARPTIKFALGENPKRSNVPSDWPRRFPQSRLGVEDVIRERFVAAMNYRETRQNWKSSRGPRPPVDYQLEALVEILEDRRDIHCHSYRQDEILMLMRLMEDLGGRVAVFQHVLEGYKVADELAAHGAMASTFSDWWAYKFEVYDAIPHNTTLMDHRGVVVSVNSDSSDLIRRMNLEAAKSVHYGGSSEEEALNLVTINPARQLGADAEVGSLEVGKSADFVIWSAPPLSTRAVCEQTWIEGAQYYDREVESLRQSERLAERQRLLERYRKAKSTDSEELAGSSYRPPFEWVSAHAERSCAEEFVNEAEVLR